MVWADYIPYVPNLPETTATRRLSVSPLRTSIPSSSDSSNFSLSSSYVRNKSDSAITQESTNTGSPRPTRLVRLQSAELCPGIQKQGPEIPQPVISHLKLGRRSLEDESPCSYCAKFLPMRSGIPTGGGLDATSRFENYSIPMQPSASSSNNSPEDLDNLQRPDETSTKPVECKMPPDSCSYVAGDDILSCEAPASMAESTPSSEESDHCLSSDSESIWFSEYSANAPKLRPSHPFRRVKDLALRLMLESLDGVHTTLYGEQNTTQGSGQSSRDSSNDSSPSGSSKKRSRDLSYSATGNGKGTNLAVPRPTKTKRRRTDERKLSFACPYSKKDPMKHRDCYKYMLTRIRDVKQHLTRRHCMPMYCPRCFATFEDEESRDEHIIENICDAVLSATKPDGITESQRQQLSKKPPTNLSQEDQWFAVWHILFPGSPRPNSPYIDSELLQDITLYQEFLTTSGPQILSDVLAQSGATITWNTPREEQDGVAFQQSILEEGLRAVFNQWAGRSGVSRLSSTVTSSSFGSTVPSTPPSSASLNGNALGHSADQSVLPQMSPNSTSEAPEAYQPHIARTTAQPTDIPSRQEVRTSQPNMLSSSASHTGFDDSARENTNRNLTPDTVTQTMDRDPGIHHVPSSDFREVVYQTDLSNLQYVLNEPFLPAMTTELGPRSQLAILEPILDDLMSFEDTGLSVDLDNDGDPGMASADYDSENREPMRQSFNRSPFLEIYEVYPDVGGTQLENGIGSWTDTV